MIGPSGDHLEAAYFVAHRFVDPLRAAGRPISDSILNYVRELDLAWELSASGPETQLASTQSELSHSVARAAAEMHCTERHVRRLAQRGDIDAEKDGRDWRIPQQAVTDYLQGRRNGRARSGS